MKILITNDDGVRAAGLVALARMAKDLGKVFVVALAGATVGGWAFDHAS